MSAERRSWSKLVEIDNRLNRVDYFRNASPSYRPPSILHFPPPIIFDFVSLPLQSSHPLLVCLRQTMRPVEDSSDQFAKIATP